MKVKRAEKNMFGQRNSIRKVYSEEKIWLQQKNPSKYEEDKRGMGGEELGKINGNSDKEIGKAICTCEFRCEARMDWQLGQIECLGV